jgi:hypothetical protein
MVERRIDILMEIFEINLHSVKQWGMIMQNKRNM